MTADLGGAHVLEEPPIAPVDHRALAATGGVGARIASLFDRTLESAVVALAVVAVAATLLQVFMRYFLSRPVVWSEELSSLVFVWLVFLGAGLGLRSGEHIAMDTFVPRLPMRVQAGIDWFVRVMTAQLAFAMTWFGWQLVQRVDARTSALEWPVWWSYASVPAGGLLLLVYLVRRVRADGPTAVNRTSAAAAGILSAYLLFASGYVTPPVWDTATVLIVAVVGLLVLGLPVAFALGVGAMYAYWANATATPLVVLPHQIENGVDSFLLLAVPFFLLAGHLMNAGGITGRIIDLASTLVGHVRGGLSHVNVLANFILGGLSGSSSADAAGLTKMLVPEMERRGYSRVYGCAVTSAGACLAQLVPPSIAMLIYASVSNASVGRLFLAGIVPGVLVTFALLATGHIICRRRGYRGLERRAGVRDVARSVRSAVWALGMPVIILGGIRYGVTTPTEAAAAAVLYALVVGAFAYRELRWRMVPRMILESSLQTAAIMLILGVSQPFSRIITLEQLPQRAAAAMTSISSEPIVLLLMINVLLLIIGLPLEPGPAIIMVTPILMPIAKVLGVDEVHLGIVMITNLIIGSLTPPVGILVFVTATIAKVRVEHVFREVTPFLIAMLAALAVITYVPALSLLLPNLLMGVSR